MPVTFRDVRGIQRSVVVHAETTMDAAALGLKRIREQQFVIEDLADPVIVEPATYAGGASPKEIAMKARAREG